ncbi:unnamed protein product [Urochloa humidicola]
MGMDLPVAPGKAVPEIPGLSVRLGPADFPTFLTEQDGGCRAYVDLLTQQCQGFEVADHVLVNSFYDLETMLSTWRRDGVPRRSGQPCRRRNSTTASRTTYPTGSTSTLR